MKFKKTIKELSLEKGWDICEECQFEDGEHSLACSHYKFEDKEK